LQDKQHINKFCRCCLLDAHDLDNNDQLFDLVLFADTYLDVLNLSADDTSKLAENHVCGNCALLLESIYIFRRMCQEIAQPIHNACRCCCQENIIGNKLVGNLKSEGFLHKNEKITYYEGLLALNITDTSNSRCSEPLICDQCALQLETIYIFQVMCREADKILRTKQSVDMEPSLHHDQYDSNVVAVEVSNTSRLKVVHGSKGENTLSNRRKSNVRSINLKPTQYSIISYNCKKCPKQFKNKIGLCSHRKIKHRDIQSTRKLYVRVYKKRKPPLRRHVKSVDLNNPKLVNSPILQKSCPTCKLKFAFRSGLQTHCRIVHKQRLYSCEKCSVNYKTEDDLKHHNFTEHLNKPFPCLLCDKLFSYSSGLSRHITIAHRNVKYECEKCPKVYLRKEGLQMHCRSVHLNNPFACQHCDKAFQRTDSLKQHIKVIHDKVLFTCEKCSLVYREKQMFLMHYNSVHLNKTFDCKPCEKKYNTTTGLKLHNRSVHQRVLFKCEKCPKTFTSRHMVKIHTASVHMNTPFVCTECQQVFISYAGLSMHKSRMHMKKKYPCEKCTKVCAKSNSLLRHIRSAHMKKLKEVNKKEEEKLYVCEYCPNVYTRKLPFQKHIQKVHHNHSQKFNSRKIM
jgi:DNA-directed RNA polymerase subunit M/transcription elongation factor TFIIS